MSSGDGQTPPVAVEKSDELNRLLYVQAPGHPRVQLVDRLAPLGFEVILAADAAEALRVLAGMTVAAAIVDLTGGRGALTTVRLLRARHPNLPVVGVFDPGVPAVSAEAIHAGLVDLLTWPFEDAELAALLADIRDRAPAAVRTADPSAPVAFSPAMRDVLRRVRELADVRQAVYLTGPDGSGKGLVARALHGGRSGPFVTVDCAGRDPADIETELLGRPSIGEPSATGETVTDQAALVRAIGGTLFIRRLDEAPARVQLRLATAMRDGEVVVEGRDGPVLLDLRIVTTLGTGANTMLRPELAARFPVTIEVPPLARRREDIPVLAARLLDRLTPPGKGPLRFSRAALELLAALPWPGNVPELERTVGALATAAARPVIQIEDVLRQVRLDGAPRLAMDHPLREARERFERELIEAALVRYRGRVGEAARALGIQRTNLYRKVRQLGISRSLLSSRR